MSSDHLKPSHRFTATRRRYPVPEPVDDAETLAGELDRLTAGEHGRSGSRSPLGSFATSVQTTMAARHTSSLDRAGIWQTALAAATREGSGERTYSVIEARQAIDLQRFMVRMQRVATWLVVVGGIGALLIALAGIGWTGSPTVTPTYAAEVMAPEADTEHLAVPNESGPACDQASSPTATHAARDHSTSTAPAREDCVIPIPSLGLPAP